MEHPHGLGCGRSLSGLPLGLSGAVWLLHLLVPSRYSNCYKAFCSASSAKSPTQQRQLLLTVHGIWWLWGPFVKGEVSVRRPMFSLRTWWCLRHHQGALGLLGTRGQGKGRPQSVKAPGPGAVPPCSSPLLQDLSAGHQGDSAGLSNEKWEDWAKEPYFCPALHYLP